VKVTISITDHLMPRTEAMVITQHLRTGPRTAADEESIIPGTLAEKFRIGGQIRDASDRPVGAADVTIVELGLATRTGLDGRFVLGMMNAGDFTLQVKTATIASSFPIKVPAPDGENYNLQLT
jgi:hypothetical protein